MRQLRETRPGATYHTVAQINRQEMIFEKDFNGETPPFKELTTKNIKELFLQVIKESRGKYKFNLKTFCIMGNHIHFMIQPLYDESISRIMQWILSVFAKRFNKIFGYKGHVWYDRFKSKIIEDFVQLVNTFRYIANNPVRACMVKHPLDYAYNGITHLHEKNYKILDPPDEKLQIMAAVYLEQFDASAAAKADRTIGFYPKKPGRKQEK